MPDLDHRPTASGRRVRRDRGPRDRYGVGRQSIPVIAVRTCALLACLLAVPLAFAWKGRGPLPFDIGDGDQHLAVEVVASELELPVSVTVTPDERGAFIAEKAGVIKYVDALRRGKVHVVADLRDRVHNFDDRGLIDIAVDPSYPDRPFIYALYAKDAPPGVDPPYWDDACTGSDAGERGRVISGEIMQLELDAQQHEVARRVVLADVWCQIGVSHGVSEMAFGPDGLLYVAAGDGASYDYPDLGQNDADFPAGPGRNGCPGDPPGEGGALRVLDALTPEDPLTYNGSIIRFDPTAAVPRIEQIAFGLRHPFGMTFRPDRDELWLIDVGWADWEEVDRVSRVSAPDAPVNFGWPCREGNFPTDGYADSPLCVRLRTAGGMTDPYAAQDRRKPFPGCANPPMAFTDVVFLPEAPWPAPQAGAMLVSDWGSGCVAMYPSDGGAPDAGKATALLGNAGLVDMDVLRDGRLLAVAVGTSGDNGYVVAIGPR